MKLYLKSLFVFASCILTHFASTLPVRMRTPELPYTEQRRDTQSIACAVQKLEEAVSHVAIEQEVPCETLSHVNITMLMSKLESLREYAIREDIFDSLASPGHVSTLLQVMNDTFATIATHVGEAGMEDIQGSVDILNCSENCRENCSLCIANCGVHRLKRGVMDLIELLKLSDCALCVEETLQTEAVELADTLDTISTDEMLSVETENFHCLPILSSHSYIHCDRLLEQQGRLETISDWMNDSLTSMNAFPNLEVLVERLRISVLPGIRKLLETLDEGNCTDLLTPDPQIECDMLPSPEQITLQVNHALCYSACNLEPQLLVNLRILELLRFNYSHFISVLLPLVDILPQRGTH